MEVALNNVSNVFDTLEKEKFWHNISATASNLKDISKALNEPKIWSESLQNIRQITTKVNKSWDTVDRAILDFSKITNGINQGEGSVGKLVKRDDLYIRLIALTNKAETTLNDINHYGVLFHLDKGWQRMRARRMNLLQKLQSPQEFRNYFNDEVDQISTSLERVAMVMEQMQNMSAMGCYDMLQNPDFVKVYSELMRRVDVIDESIKMYNQQVADTAHQELNNCCGE